MARIVETLAPMLISINVRYKSAAGIRITGSARGRSLGVSGSSAAWSSPGGPAGRSWRPACRTCSATGLSVIANTADDIEIVGVDVSPDPDLITYWLSGEIDEQRGWGIKGDSFTAFDRLVRLGAPDWFRLSDRDLATCLYRRVFVADGGRRTDAQAQIARALGVRGGGAADVRGAGPNPGAGPPQGWRDLQHYLVAEHAEAPVEGIEVDGIADAAPTPEVLSSDRRGRGDRHRAVQPGDLDRPDPLDRRRCGRRSPPRRRPWWRSAPTSPGRW